MPALSIQPTYPILTDIDGQPLENGFVWVGAANLDPQANPITAYWDAALTQVAKQPVRTRGGYPANNGTPGRLYVNVSTSYSIRVQNKNGSLVYSAPTATERQIAGNVSYTPGANSLLTATTVQAALDQVSDDEDGSSYVGFLQAGTGAVATTVQAKLRESVSVKDFGAVGDGAADDTVAIQAALTAGAGKGVFFPAGSYSISADLSVPAGTYVYAHGSSATVTQSTAGENAFTFAGDNVTIDGLFIVGPNSGLGSAVRADAVANPTVVNCKIRNWLYGIQVRGCQNTEIKANRLWGGTYNATSSSDIIVFGSSAAESNRTIISGNFCLSNTDNGINVDTNSGDRHTIISENIVSTCDDNGVAERSDADNYRRNGIIVGYNGNANSRAVISNNIVRNAPYSGIYTQGAVLPAGDVVISGNLVSRCGWGTKYPSDASIRAGILIASGGQDSITGNTLVDCSTAAIKYAPDFGRDLTNGHRPVISGNMVSRTTGIGIFLTNRPFGVQVCANRIINSTTESIYFQPSNNPSDIGNVLIDGNHIDTTSTSGGIVFDAVYSTTYTNKISNNKILGADKVTTGVFNSGVYARGDVKVSGNNIQTFYRGIIFDESDSVLNTSWTCNGNFLENCEIGISGGQGTGTRVAQGNQFHSVTTRVTGCYEGAIVSARLHVVGAAAPTTGAWGQGDYMKQATPSFGQPKGWYCTVTGSPGTWVSEGTL